METTIFSNQHNITVKQLTAYLDHSLSQPINVFKLWDISISPSGYGHYKIVSKFEVDGNDFKMKAKTCNMQLIDAWKSGINDNYEAGDDGFDNWDEVVESMLDASFITNILNSELSYES